MKTSLVRMLGYAHGGYFMAKAFPSPDVADNDDEHHARSWVLAPEGGAKADDS
jgi:hypothetical protein